MLSDSSYCRLPQVWGIHIWTLIIFLQAYLEAHFDQSSLRESPLSGANMIPDSEVTLIVTVLNTNGFYYIPPNQLLLEATRKVSRILLRLAVSI